MKKIISIIMVSVLLFFFLSVTLTGCSKEDHIVFNVMAYGINSTVSSLDDEIGQEIYEKFGVEIVFIPQSDVDPLSMLYANDWGDLDMIATYEDSVTTKYIEANAFYCLDDYKEKLSNFFDYHSESIPYWRSLDKEKSKLYVWQAGPDQSHLSSSPLDVCVRVDVLEACGWPQLETTDDYIAFLKQAHELFPKSFSGSESIPMITYWADYYGPLLSTYLPRHSGMQHFYKLTGLIDVENEKVVPMVDNPYFVATMKFWNEMYNEGLLDREAFTTTEEDFNEKFLSGVALTANFATWMVPEVNAAMLEAGHEEMQYIVMPIRLSIANDENVNTRYESYTYLCPDETRGILKTCENPELLLDVINYLSTKEMSIRAGWGVKGTDYVIDDNGLRQVTNEFIDIATSTTAQEELSKRGIGFLYQQVFPMKLYSLDDNGQAYWYSQSTEYLNAIASPVQKKAYDTYSWDTFMSPFVDNKSFELIPFDLSYYQVATTFDSGSEYAIIEQKITEYLNRQIPQIVTAPDQSTFDSILNTTISNCYDLGLEQLIKEYNKRLPEAESTIDNLKD